MANADITVTKNKPNLAAETIKDAFGKNAEDVLSPIASATEVCSWLDAIIGAIRRETKLDNPSIIAIGSLADAARYIADDFANYYDSQHEEMFKNLKQAGVIAAEAERHGQ